MSNKTVSHDDDHLDFAKIEREVQNAVIHEERYWRENDAKIRAVEQRVPTYDDFREMVMAAHLRPLEKGDRISDIGRFTQVWNQLAVGQSTQSTSIDNAQGSQFDGNGLCMPTSGQAFLQMWKRLNKNRDDQKNYLLIVGPERLGTLFKTEITGGLLGDFFECFKLIKKTETEVVINVLEVFTKSQRFSLSLAFLSKADKLSGVEVFQHLNEICDENLKQRLIEIEKKYNLK